MPQGRKQRVRRTGKKKVKSRRSRTTQISKTLTPPRKRVWLEYVSVQTLSTASHFNFGYPIYTNGAFAVDPSAPTGYTTTPGFSVLATNYAAYRVRRYRGSVSFVNLTATGGDTIVCHSNSNLGFSNGGTASPMLQYAANRPTVNTIKAISALGSGNNKVVHTFKHTIPFITGESLEQPGYKCLTNTVPSVLTYLVFGWQFPTTQTGGMTVAVKLQMEVEYLDYIDTLTSFSDEVSRLKSFSQPVPSPPCAGCRSVAELEQIPCPDPECTIVDMCTNCGYSRSCTLNCQSTRCPFRKDKIKILPPVLERKNSLNAARKL